MARKSNQLAVIVSPTAVDELWNIWKFNADRYGYDHAQEYEAFLKAGIYALGASFNEGKDVDGFPELKSVTLKKGRRGDGHIVIYEVDETNQTVNVHHIYHTKMDVVSRLERER